MNRNWDAAFAACKSYEEAEVSAALQAAIDAAGGLDWVTPGMRVALKLNLVSAMKPEQAATVHPAVVCALVKLLTARGAHVILGDSPGGLYTAAHLQRVYDVTGLRAAEALGAESFPRTVMCLAVFAERGLVTVERHDKYITLRLTGGKRVDLDASPYLCALREGLDGTKGGSSV